MMKSKIKNKYHFFRELTKSVSTSPDDINVVMLPLYHTFGISSILDNMVRGLPYVLIPHFTFQKMLEAIQEYKVYLSSS